MSLVQLVFWWTTILDKNKGAAYFSGSRDIVNRHEKFLYKSLDEIRQDTKKLGISIPISEDLDIFKKPVSIGKRHIPNSLGIHPMEGCDGTSKGRPDELTFRRYDRFARGGAGLLWFEATAVVHEGRANPRQLHICEDNKEDIKKLLDSSVIAAKEEFGDDHEPYTVLQLTHSGRYSRPGEQPSPIIATQNPYLNKNIPSDYPIITDAELEELEDRFVDAAVLAKEIGFHSVDIKSCHGYLNSELLSAFTREGKYGGSFENRTRFLLNIVQKVKERVGDKLDITLRLNAYDSIPYPYGWGVDKDDFTKPDIREPIRLVKALQEKGVKLINISTGNPYYNPHIGRPYDIGYYLPYEHPLEAIARMLNIIQQIQNSVPQMAVMATGFSWLREFAPYVAAGGIREGWFTLAGFGRQSFAYPDFARDIIDKSSMDRSKCCIACGKCSEIMRDGGRTGCVIKDSKVYAPIYRQGRQGKPPITGTHIAHHV
ncbi:MAG TPA: flavin oxidoreductase/NADH oxidase [Clostridia bacterium]|nr:flavin oxidoreductase/NADH oxidase [Clostridia bacterium]